MREESSERPEADRFLEQSLLNLRFTHKRTPVDLLETLTFRDPGKAMAEMFRRFRLSECLLLQTCNRAEIYLVAQRDLEEVRRSVIEYWRSVAGVPGTVFQRHLEESRDSEVLRHLLRLAAGLESMIVGEDQILGQIRESLKRCKALGVLGPLLDLTFTRAVRSGGRIRSETGINKGAVSLGSAAVQMTERIIPDLEGRRVMIIGAGDTGALIGKALSARRHRAIYVANRTYDRAVRLAKLLGGEPVRYSKIDSLLQRVDVVFVATSAPHLTLRLEQVARAIKKRGNRPLLIFDLSQPRNVEPSISSIRNVKLLDIDVLRGVAEDNMKARLREIEKAELLVEAELQSLEAALRRSRLEPLISELFILAEEIRRREFMKARKLLGNIDEDQLAVVEKLTRVIVEKILHNPVNNLRRAGENDRELHKIACRLFGLEAASRCR
ncbi:glutamyl-tRNA reductase [Candidatus Bathyarchaeota archaeon]|nr:glutamyl-tRNA reductase [Candidatus Bathyarchaeota archaeon]